MRFLKQLGKLRPTLDVLLLLALVELFVRGPFVHRYILPQYAPLGHTLRERTGFQNLAVFFDGLRARRHEQAIVAMVGDSTLKALDEPENTIIPIMVQDEVRRRLAGLGEIEVVDAANVGLFANDALLMISKLIDADVDVIVYGVQLRALKRANEELFTTRISSELDASDLWRIGRAGGTPWLLDNVGVSGAASGLAYSHWQLYAYRTNLKVFAWQKTLEPLAGRWPALRAVEPFEGLRLPQIAPREWPKYDWPREEYGFPNRNWDALALIAQLCARYAPGRCVLYSGPLDPSGREKAAEPGFYESYREHVRAIVATNDVVWRDYTDAMETSDFNPRRFGAGPDPIHLAAVGRAKLSKMLIEPIQEGLARRREQLGRRVATR